MQIQGVMAMVLVDNIERALRFYRDVLGFTVRFEEEDWVVFEEGVGLMLSPEPIPEINRNINAVSLSLTVDDVEATFKELTAQGVGFFVPPTTDGSATFASFRDTENNLIQLLQLPTSS
ncbi:MAG: VOC family protein [Armatimonadetes bacterium]|nr:VOC family protein [Armatimonadota bacterium]